MKLEDVVTQLASLTADAVGVVARADAEAPPLILWVNDAFCQVVHRSREALLNRDPYDVLHHPEYVDDFRGNLAESMDNGKNEFEIDTKCLRGDGTEFWANFKVKAIPKENGGRLAILSLRDVELSKSREQAAELALIENDGLLKQIEAAQMRLVSAINTTPDAFAIFDRKGRLDIWNPAFANYATANPGRLTKGMKFIDVARLSVAEGLIDTAVGQEEDWLERQAARWDADEPDERIVSSRGRQFRVSQTATPNGDRVIHCVDISELVNQQRELEGYAGRLEQANNEIRHQALHDELTGLGNRRFLNVKLEEWIERQTREGGEIAALHVDLDRFKHINDTLGHGAGDFVLTDVADKLRARVRSTDVVARTGGDEFVVLVACTGDSDAPERLAERLIEDLSQPLCIEDRPCMIGASIGVARTPVVPADQLLTSSDIALYKAKEGGRSMVAIFDILDLENMRAAKELSDDVTRGVRNREFRPVYQTQVDAATGEVTALEVLARWQHPEEGLLAPDRFLGIAAETKLDGEIDRMIFDAAIRECRETFGDYGTLPSLSFNVSQPRLMGERLLNDIMAADYGGPIAFELLETIFLEDETAEFAERIAAIRDLGLTLEVDDFGSGRASIVGLRRIGPDRLKIDRRLVEPVATSESSRRLVRSIVDIGNALEIGVTAEGVETADQAGILAELGCDRLQGYHFSRPAILTQVPGLARPERRARAAAE